MLELFFALFFKRKANKIKSVFLNGLWKKPAIPLSFSAFPVYVGNWVEVLWRQKTFWNVEKKVSCKSSKLLQDFRIWTLRGASYFFFPRRESTSTTIDSGSKFIRSGRRRQRMTKYLWICAGICVCMDLHVLYAYREYYIGGIGSSSEQLRSWNNCFPENTYPGYQRGAVLNILNCMLHWHPPIEGFSSSKLQVCWKSLQDLMCLLKSV